MFLSNVFSSFHYNATSGINHGVAQGNAASFAMSKSKKACLCAKH
jgi:hypothetical protein